MGGSDDDSCRDEMAIDGDATGQDLTRQDTANRRRHTHGLIDTGTKIGARCKSRSLDNLFNVGELASDFVNNLLHSVGVAGKVEQGRGHGSRGGIRSGNNASYFMSV